MTDVIKYREDTPSKPALDVSVRLELIRELEYIDPDLIFTFGSRAWNTVRTHLQAEPLGNIDDPSSITEVHGKPHRATQGSDTMMLPCGHMSPQFRGAQVSHEEYMTRIESGIDEVRQL